MILGGNLRSYEVDERGPSRMISKKNCPYSERHMKRGQIRFSFTILRIFSPRTMLDRRFKDEQPVKGGRSR
jgi:hypothetical protein